MRRDGMMLALTRARLRPTRAASFWRAIKPVAAEVDQAPGLLAHFGIGEAPLGWQGTVSIWRDAADLAGFAYRQPEHRAVIARTPTDRWYAEELFARFAVDEITGDREVLGWHP
ncbi:MAG TPA: monooxygenase, partial [Actinoplanes sp.]|nr:monooxygenase [Actinoplanes sp.]